MKKKKFLLVVSTVIAFQSCGRRALPTSPDRWAPKIAGVTAVDRNHVDCVFSERMSRESFVSASQFRIIDAVTGDTIPVIAAVLGSNDIIAHLTTHETDTVEYILTCESIADASGNYIRPVEKTFIGSSALDTTPPVLVSVEPGLYDLNGSLDSAVVAVFSEPVDASSPENHLYIAGNSELGFLSEFSTDYTQFKITFPPEADTFESRKRLYSVMLAGFSDIAGNKMAGFGNFRVVRGIRGLARNITLYFPDSSFEGFFAVTGDSFELIDFVPASGGRYCVPFLEQGNYRAIAFSAGFDSIKTEGSALFTADSSLPEIFVELNEEDIPMLTYDVKEFILRIVK